MKEKPYKLAYKERQKLMVAARKALIAADAHYYAWTPQEQECFRATMGEDASRRIQCVLLDDLLDIKCRSDEVDEAWKNVSLTDLNQLNWARLLTAGIGEDYIYLNESMAEGKTLLDFPTLYDYDYADYVFQEEARKRDFPDYKGIEYYAYQHPSWVRLLIQEQFYYATFTSLATYVLDEVESAGDEIIRQLIPHEYVDGKNHGKQDKGGFLWDVNIDAAGQEAQLDELRSRWYGYQRERWLALSESNVQRHSAVYVHDKDWDDDPHRFFVFTNERTLKQIRWRHFLSDCNSRVADYAEVEKFLAEEIDRANAWLVENHQDIQENFDPKVVKLKKKRKIILTESALDDLSKIDTDKE
ncbi:MAG: hypothetical protein KDI43_03775 [Gammaproteobacteria bacterium]|nr:hypothetical protein [Gammaproteobacteria bacterium]MCP5407403.1 hypothetical protein [Chromatiaceae bacterium]MCP5443962.1 hypothetical protein [Chromatiaceae bacterium]